MDETALASDFRARQVESVRMMRIVLIMFFVLVGLVGCASIVARFADGPIGPFPGGALGGERVTEPVADWVPIMTDVGSIELEVNPARPRSVTTSYILRDGKLYVPSIIAARKQWPKEALADDRVVLRIRGKLYERQAVRVTDPDELRKLVRGVESSADRELDVTALSTWYFRMDARSPGGAGASVLP